IDPNTWNVLQFDTNINTQYTEIDDDSEKNFNLEISNQIDNCNNDHDCQDIVAVRLFIDNPELQKPVAESVASSFLKFYFCQKDANGHDKDELKLSVKRDPKNKKKSRLVSGETI
ncbi:8950_t:CDS:2, partial [Racocetra persica]